ncbi:hypothetical protein llg_34380 [Luteolibacter sp. LG18]|nr:hypothetical protein llg_34380 [Luteolibacter sp. LG18]
MGLGATEMVKVHEDALTALKLQRHREPDSDGALRQAGEFFARALAPFEEAHRGARETNARLESVVGKLSQRTVELAASNAELNREIVRRKRVEKSLRTSETTSSQLLAKSRRMQEELRLLSRRLLSAQEEERKRISRELHDVIAQALTGINVRLATLTLQNTANAQELHEKISVAQRLVEKSVEIVHAFARDLRPTVLDDLGLVPALKSHLKSFTEQTGLPVRLTTFTGVEDLPGSSRTVLYRVAQEALTNISRHAKASRAKVRILRMDQGVRMEISDDGRGFPANGIASSRRKKGLGILGMRERAEMVGGVFTLESTPGKGTTVRLDLPDGYPAEGKKPAPWRGKVSLLA